MNRSENTEDNFARKWREALGNAEVTPPASVWSEIDRSLANQEVVNLRKRAFIYKWAAVVAILIAVAVSIPNFLDLESTLVEVSTRDSFDVANVADYPQQQREQGSSGLTIPERKLPVVDSGSKSNKSSYEALAGNQKIQRMRVGLLPVMETQDEKPLSDESAQVAEVDRSVVPVIEMPKRKDASSFVVDTRELRDFQPTPIYIFEKKSQTRSKAAGKKDLWASVEIGTGSFDPNYQLTSSNPVTTAMLAGDQGSFINQDGARASMPLIDENITAGVNYQLGMNFGMEVLNRVTLESGVQYAQAQTTTSTNITIENRFFNESVALTSEAATIDAVANIADEQEIIEYRQGDVSLENTFQFASIPVKAGYVVVDRKFNVRFNAGMIANLYLGNTLEESANRVATLEINPGNNSPYRDVSWQGTAGVSFGYEFRDRLDLTVEPNYAHALTPLTKNSSNFDFSPTGIGVMAGLRYRFK